jgi:regulator-associated protein of mTOR
MLTRNSVKKKKADGVVRLFRNYDPAAGQGPVQMVSSFRALNEVVQMTKGSGVIMDWKRSGGSLLVGGDSRIIRVWDAHTETQVLVSNTISVSYL